MTLAEKQRQMVEDYSLIEDRMERFSVIVSRRNPLPPLHPEERTEEHFVPGCTSRVWLVGDLVDEVCLFRTASESPIVGAVAVLLCELYHDASPAEAAAFDNSLIEDLKIADQLTPTRRRGVRQITARIRELAAQWCQE